jgi:fatty-acyl-CoA synthase
VGPFVAMLTRAAATSPNKIALHYGDRQITYSDLEEVTRRVAAALARLGIGESDRVALWLPNTPAFVVLLLACLRLGAIAVTVNTRFRSHEVGDVLHRTGAKALVLWPGFHVVPFLDIMAGVDPAAIERIDSIILYDEGEPTPTALPFRNAKIVRYGDLLSAAAVSPDEHFGEGGVTFTTSGTTKAPKFVKHGQSASAIHGLAVARAFEYDAPGAKVLIVAPLCGIFGYTQFVAAIAVGATVELIPLMDVDAVAEALRNGVTHMNGTDTLYRRILAKETAQRPFPQLKPSVLAPFDYPPEETVALAESRGVSLVGAYGMTEIFAMFSKQPLEMRAAERAKGGGYLVSRQTQMRVRDPDSGCLLPPGGRGEFEVRGPSVMMEYFGAPEATAGAFTEDGFLRTGDMGCIEEDGRILYEARMIEMVRLGGFLVNPVEIETQLLRHSGIEFAQVVVVPGLDGNKAVGFVVMKPAAILDEPAVRAMCEKSMARYKTPARIVAVPEFPTTDGVNGVKIQRAKLREMAASILTVV